MNGILNILKPAGMTSFDIVARVRGMVRQKKCGHSGTLDPMAVGVLPVFLGNATKAIEFMMEKDKLYRAELTLGLSTDTQDSTGEVTNEKEVNFTDEEIVKAINSFEGKSMQLPPMYSAIKINGKKLYELAREGLEIERNPRHIEIYSIDVVDINKDGRIKILFDVYCSKGTYIRTLCADIGEKLGCGGHMSFLLRKKAGSFDISCAVTLEEFKAAVDEGMSGKLLMDVENVFDSLLGIQLDGEAGKRLRNGMVINLPHNGEYTEGLVKVYGQDGNFFALGEIASENGRFYLRSRKFFE